MQNTPENRIALLFVLLFIAIVQDAGLRHAFPYMVRSGQAQNSLQISSQPAPISQNADPAAVFSSDAGQAIAGDLLQEDETRFSKSFSVRCLSVSKAEKRFNGYGVNTDMIVITARFELSKIADGKSLPSWTKFYAVSVTIDAGQFQGLTDTDTKQRVLDELEKQIQADVDSFTILRNASTH